LKFFFATKKIYIQGNKRLPKNREEKISSIIGIDLVQIFFYFYQKKEFVIINKIVDKKL
jgi:hypothetical protein